MTVAAQASNSVADSAIESGSMPNQETATPAARMASIPNGKANAPRLLRRGPLSSSHNTAPQPKTASNWFSSVEEGLRE
ncbi:hypothetical protein GCM10009107_06960 [Ideonella azotifigens]|uniref:Uncharacterized protein n=1 Tax=Ideonella azotifigens TaxID=513160 RepID=A0ABN1JMP2_9BURK